MKTQRISSRLIAKYIALQIPALLLLVILLLAGQHWLQLPAWLAWTIILLWLLKDALLFPYIWRSHDPDYQGHSPHFGERGIVRQDLAPKGLIWIHGEIWQAEVPEGGRVVPAGQPVRVQGIRGLILLVEPEREEEQE